MPKITFESIIAVGRNIHGKAVAMCRATYYWLLDRWAYLLTVVSGSVTVALMALVIEDLLPNVPPGGSVPARWSWPRWLLLAVSVVFLVVGLWVSFRMGQKRGSAYIVQVQDRAAPRWHTDKLVGAARRYKREVTLVERLDFSTSGALDLRDTVKSLGADLRDEQNNDDNSTGFSYYPNLLFPAGVALGYSWEPPRKTVLHEVNGPIGRPDFCFDLEDVGLAHRHAGRDGVRVSHEVRLLSVAADETCDEDVVAVSLVIVLSAAHDLPAAPEDVAAIKGYSGFQREYVVGVTDRSSGKLLPVKIERSWRRHPDGMSDGHVRLTPGDVVVGAGQAVGEVLMKHPNATVVVLGRLPKTATMPLGRYLATAGDGTSAPTVPSWRRLVLLGLIGGVLHPAWVDQEQPEPLQYLRSRRIAHPFTSARM